MAIEVGSAYMSILPSTDQLAPGITKALQGASSKAAATGKDAGGKFSGGMRAGIAGMATKVFAPLAAVAGTAALGSWAKNAVMGASDLSESLNALKVTYGENASAVEEMGRSAATSLGLSSLEFNNLAVRFSNFSKTIAGPGGDVVGTLDDLTQRATDFASVMNLDVAQAAELFQSGLAGETEPLRQFGIDMSAAAVEAYAMSHGIADSAASMTEAQKVQARYGLLMSQTANTQGDFANTSDGLANQLRILGGQWENVTAKLGSAFLPAAKTAVGFITGSIMPALDKFATGVQGLSALLFEGDFTSALTDAFNWEEDNPAVTMIMGIRQAFESGGFVAAASKAISALSQWLSTTGVQTISTSLLSGKANFVTAAGELLQSLVTGLTNALPTLMTTVVGLVSQLGQYITSAAPTFLQAAVTLFQGLAQAVAVVLPVIVTAVVGLVTSLVPALLSMLPALLQAGVALFRSLVQAVVVALPQIVMALATLLPQIVTAVLGLIPQLLTAGISVFTTLIQAVVTVLPQLLTVILGTLLPQTVGAVLQMLPQILTAAIQVFLALVQAVIQVLPQLLGIIFGTLIPQVIGAVLQMLPQLLVAAVQVFLALVKGLIQVIPSVLGAITGNLIPNVISAVSRLIGQMLSKGAEIMRGLADGLGNGVSAVMSFLGRLPGMVTGALSDAGSWLYESGKKIIGGLIDGIKNMAGNVKDAIGGVLSKARDLLPFSPAKEGPFSGRGWTLYSGRSITEALAEGITGGKADVLRAARTVMGAASDTLSTGIPVPVAPGSTLAAYEQSRVLAARPAVSVAVKPVPAADRPARFDLQLDRQSKITLHGYVREIADETYQVGQQYADTVRRMRG